MRNVLLKVHLYLGLSAGIFLVILGLTVAIIAFENDVDRWTSPSLWYARGGPKTLPEAALIRAAQEKFAPARVTAVQISRRPDLVRVMQLSDRSVVYVNPFDGSIQGRTTGPSGLQTTFGIIHQIHLRLAATPRSAFSAIGKKIVSWAGLFRLLLVPTGLILWWRTRRASIKFSASWFRICFDAHQAIGIYAGLFLFLATLTGILIGFDFGEEAIYVMTKSARPNFREKPPQSSPQPDARPIDVDRAVEIARAAMPDATVAVIQLPQNAKAVYTVLMRMPEETSEAVHSAVMIDRYSGQVLRVRDFRKDSQGYRWIRFNRSIHTGDVLGTPTHIVMSLSSLLLAAMAVTGIVIWWKKLAVS